MNESAGVRSASFPVGSVDHYRTHFNIASIAMNALAIPHVEKTSSSLAPPTSTTSTAPRTSALFARAIKSTVIVINVATFAPVESQRPDTPPAKRRRTAGSATLAADLLLAAIGVIVLIVAIRSHGLAKELALAGAGAAVAIAISRGLRKREFDGYETGSASFEKLGSGTVGLSIESSNTPTGSPHFAQASTESQRYGSQVAIPVCLLGLGIVLQSQVNDVKASDEELDALLAAIKTKIHPTEPERSDPLDRVRRAIEWGEQLARRPIGGAKSHYNFACFFTLGSKLQAEKSPTHTRYLNDAIAHLSYAISLEPHLRASAMNDPSLVQLHEQKPDEWKAVVDPSDETSTPKGTAGTTPPAPLP